MNGFVLSILPKKKRDNRKSNNKMGGGLKEL